MDSARNALYQTLAPLHAAHGTYPTLRQLLALLRGERAAMQSVHDRLHSKGLLERYKHLLDARTRQRESREDPAASLIERLGLLNRPALVTLLDEKRDKFQMADINTPRRVRIALPEGTFPDAARILARLAVSQFVQVASATTANPDIFKGLVIDEAGRYIDDYVTLGLQRIRCWTALGMRM